ncbi:MAG: ANTAR domain-containing protein [Bryobacteraceae bacterium]
MPKTLPMLAGLYRRVSRLASADVTLDEMLGEVLGLAVQVSSCDACLIYVLDPTSGELLLRASQVPHAAELGELSLKVGEGVTGWVAEHRELVAIAANAPDDPRFKCFGHIIEDTYDAFLSVPLMSQGTVAGVVNIHHREAHEHSAEELEAITFIAEQVGNAVARAQLAEQVERLSDELATRKVVERAKGILMRNRGLTEEQAYLMLRGESRKGRRPMKQLAEAIILVEELNKPRV